MSDLIEEAREMLALLLPLRSTLSRLDRAFVDSWRQALERGRDLEGKRLTFLRRVVEDVRSGELRVKR